MQRRQFLTTLGATAAATTMPGFIGPLTLSSSETLTPLALESDLEIDKFGSDANPSFVLRYSDDEHREDLESWVDDTEDGRVIRDLETIDMMVVSVPWSAAGRSSFVGIHRYSGGFDDLGYLEFADANAFVSRPEPIEDLATRSDVGYDLRARDKVSIMVTRGTQSAEPGYGGLAFDDDAPEATLRDARNLVQAGNSALSDVDTSSVTVAVIDTGANDGSHFDDADGNLRFHEDSTDFTSVGDPTVSEDGASAVADGDDHGSWVSACIAADNSDSRYTGFAPDAELVVAKSLDDDGRGSIGNIVAGVELAIDTGADVACMSLGSLQWSDALAAALEDAWEAGIFPVVATGNDRYASTFVASPASSQDAFGVNATNVPESGDRDDTLIAYFGNVGPHSGTLDLSGGESEGATPQLAAPGMNVEIDPVGTLTGTSMAAPMVAGAAAVLAAEGHDNEETWDRLTESAYPLESAGETETEFGLLDVEAALNGTERDETQADVRDDDAIARDEFNRAYSETRGRRLAGLF